MIIALRAVAIIAGLLPILWLGVRVEADDGWWTIAGYEWAFHGVPRIPPFVGSAGGDEILHLMWTMVSGAAAVSIRLFSELMPFVVCARIPMLICSMAAVLLLGIRGSKVVGQGPAWGAAAFLAMDSIVFLNARTVRPEALLLPVFVWIFLQFFLVLDGKRRPCSMFGISVLLGCGWALFHPNSIMVPAIVLISALLFGGNRKTAFRALSWTVLGMASGLVLYHIVIHLIAYCGFGNYYARESSLQHVIGKAISQSRGEEKNHVYLIWSEEKNYLYRIWSLVRRWCIFPYRAIVLVCAGMAAYGIRKDLKLRFLAIAAFLYLMMYAVFLGTINVRYMAYVALLMAPVVGVCLADRKKLFGPVGRKIFVCVYIATLLSGFGNAYGIFRLKPASAENLKAIIEANVPPDKTIVGRLWIGGVLPDRKLVFSSNFLKYFTRNREEGYYLVDDGLYGYGDQKRIALFLEENGYGRRFVAEYPMPRFKYIRIFEIVHLSGGDRVSVNRSVSSNGVSVEQE